MPRPHMSPEAHRYAAEELALEAEKLARTAARTAAANFQEAAGSAASALAAAGMLHLELSRPQGAEQGTGRVEGVEVTITADPGASGREILEAFERSRRALGPRAF